MEGNYSALVVVSVCFVISVSINVAGEVSCKVVAELGTADAEMMHASMQNPDLKGCPFKAWSRYDYSQSMLRPLLEICSCLISTFPVHSA